MLLLDVIPDPTEPVVTPPPDAPTAVIEAGPFSEPAVAPWSDGEMTTSFSYSYVQGAELPALRLLWADGDKVPIDFTTGFTFQFLVGPIGDTAIFVKSTGILGAVGHIDVIWSPEPGEDLNLLPVGRHAAEIRARRTSDAADRIRQGEIIIEPGIQG